MIPGPAALGRGVVMSGAGPVPSPWSGVAEVVIDDGALAAPQRAVAALHDAWAQRHPVVVRLLVDAAAFRSPATVTAEAWTLTPDVELWADRLHFLVWANTYDGRDLSGPPVWWWARKALRLGASPLVGGPGDVVLPDGRAAWIDGGPRRPWPAAEPWGAYVVHRESVERGRLDVAPAACEPSGASALAPDQAAAVAHCSGPARIIAPAGSGKTRVLTERLRHLLLDRRWERDSVLAVAYNKKAQEEMRARTSDVAPRTRTLNSLGLEVLARAGRRPPPLLDERQVRRIVERLAPATRRRVNTDPIAPYLEALSAVRLGLRDPAAVEGERDDVPGLAGLWPRFREALAAEGAVDFDHQVYGAVEALLRDGELRARLQVEHRHLLVDELQDLTPAHVLLIRLLCAPGFDCFGVGDDDQVIYGHAGADPAFLIGYERLFPGAASHPLEVNYRCPPDVVRAASALLSYNHRRVAKAIRAGRPPGPPALEVRTEPGGRTAVAEVVSSWLAAGAAPAEVAVLTRVNAGMLAPHVALVDAEVPVASSLRPEILERTGLRAALAWLRLATAADGALASGDLVEVLRRPSRGLPPWFAERLRRRQEWSTSTLAGLAGSVPDKDRSKVEGLVSDLLALRRTASRGGAGGRAGASGPPDPAQTAQVVRQIRDQVGLGGAMSLLDGGRGGEGSSHLDDLDALEAVALVRAAGGEDHPAGFEEWLRDRLSRPGDPGGVTVSTVHRVKGMEWDRVVVAGVSAGILPHRLSEDVEEERRVLHVAVTRGRQAVVVLSDVARPSPFLAELAGEAPHVAPAPRRAPAPAPAARPPRPTASDSGDPALEEALKVWRRRRAAQDGVPAYVVFNDRTLHAIAASRPETLAALRRVDGIGPTKLELYGEELLALVVGTAAAGDR